MRWFTDDAYESDEFDWGRMLADYHAYVESISALLSPDLLALAKEPRLNLHDARFREVRLDREAAEVEMVIECGDLQVGYRQIHLRLGAAAIVPDNLYLLGAAVGAEFRGNHWHRGRAVTEIMAHEVDVRPDGRFLLSLRLSPFYEFAVEFASHTVTETPFAESGPARAGRFILGPR